MNYIERIRELNKTGITVKAIAVLAELRAGTLYNYVCGRTKLSKAAEKRLNAALELIEDIRGVNNGILSKSKRNSNT